MAKIYNPVLRDNPLSIPLSQLHSNIRVCQKESGYYLPIDILQCFTTGCKPKLNARKPRITTEQCEHKLLMQIGYLIATITGEPRADWSAVAAVFMEKGRVDEDMLDIMATDFPVWFRKLPTITILFFFVFVFAAQLFVTAQANNQNTTHADTLRLADEHDLWRQVMQEVNQFLTEKIPLSQAEVAQQAHMLHFLDHRVEHGVKSDLQASMQLLNDLNKILPLSCALNSKSCTNIRETWRVECHDMDATPRLKCFDTREWKWLLFETRLNEWIHALRRLYRERNDDAHTLITTYQVCDATCNKKSANGMEWHGYKESDGCNMLRPVRLQSDLLLIWTQLISLTQPFTAAAHANTRSDLCAALRAHLGALVDGALLLATVFRDCGTRFIDGAHAVWRQPNKLPCQRRDCATCARNAPVSPGSGVSEEGEH
ncbi:unnamed protein product [Agarophyton chilense]